MSRAWLDFYRAGKRSRRFAGFFLTDAAVAEGQVFRSRAELQRAACGESRAFFQCAQLGRLLFVVAGQPGQDIALVVAGLDQRLARQVAGDTQGHGSECHRLVEFVHAERRIAGLFKGLVERWQILCGMGGQRCKQAEERAIKAVRFKVFSQSRDSFPWMVVSRSTPCVDGFNKDRAR